MNYYDEDAKIVFRFLLIAMILVKILLASVMIVDRICTHIEKIEAIKYGVELKDN